MAEPTTAPPEQPAPPPVAPPPPVEPQTDSPEVQQQTLENVSNIFDRVLPQKGEKKPPATPQEPPKPPTPTSEPPKPPTAEPPKPQEPPKPPELERKLPSFIEEALKVEPQAPSTPQDEVFPETPPEFKTPEERNARYKAWRGEYERIKKENEDLKQRPAVEPERVTFLETQNKELSGRLAEFEVSTDAEFNQKIIQPMTAAWNEAARIVQSAGADPDDLAKAMTLSGKAQYEALDVIFEGMPESARLDVQNALGAYRRLEETRRGALKDAPRVAAEIRKRNLMRQQEYISKQKEQMSGLFDEAVRKLRDEAKVEILQKSDNPEDKWWNDEGDDAVKLARNLYLDNADLGRMAMACVLAPLADKYRKLWYQERAARNAAEKQLKEKFGSEPSMSEGAGPGRESQTPMEEDLKRPFEDVFLDKFHQLRAQGR